jgi:naphthoate synthase
MVSEIFDPERWHRVEGFSFTDITYHRAVDSGTVRIAFDRPEVRNAFRPHTVDELYRALDHARMSGDVGCVLLTGNGPSPKDGGWAFCSGGDQRIRGRDGYRYADGETAETIDPARAGRLHIMEVHRLIRFMPKVVIAVVPGWAAGGGHSLHVVCDLTLASREHARFKQTDADVGSFDGGFGSAYLARQVGQKFAREIFFLGDTYDAADAHRMGMVNAVVPHADLEGVALEWAAKINAKSPTSQRMLKYAFNLIDDGLVGQQVFAAEATRLAYMTDEAVEGRDAFLEKRRPDWTGFPYYYLVGEVAAVVLEDETDRGEHGEQHPEQEQPPADREAERRRGGAETQEQRPPAVRAEEPDLAGALLDLALVVVFGPQGQAAPGEQHVEAGEHGQAHGERERGGPGRVVRDIPVHDVRAAEEDPAAEEQPAFDLHASNPLFPTALSRVGISCSSPCDSRPHLMSG